jgi:oxygen-independent coproporphyrinogen-3 oxidase
MVKNHRFSGGLLYPRFERKYIKIVAAGIYLHIPFCKSRCSYCDFATDIYRSPEAVDRYVAAICREINESGVADPKSEIRNLKSADTIYFGGGTPSLLFPHQVERILKTVNENFNVVRNTEITMEMNPATVTPESLWAFKSLGVNRASFGVQTFNDRALKLLGRGHDANDARKTYKLLREADFENISFDLIAGLPGQTLDDWQRNLDEAISMSPEHLSLYLLEIHEGTPLAEQVRGGRQPTPDDDLAAAMYEIMCERLAAAGYEQYEISNFSRPGFESRHNTKYWLLDPVYGFGVSAHSFDGYERYANERDTNCYVETIESAGNAETSRQSIDAISETMFLGLRLNGGIDIDALSKRFKVSITDKYCSEIEELQELELLKTNGTNLRLTNKGRLFSNEVFQRFI